MREELNKRDIDKRINGFFFIVKDLLGDRFYEILAELKIDRCSNFSRLPLHSLISVFNSLNVTLDSVLNQSVEMSTVQNQANRNDDMPIRYIGKIPYSSRFTGFYMLDYIEKYFGTPSANLTRQHLQLKKSHFLDVTLKNNLLLPIHITNYVSAFHGKHHVERMGQNSMNLYRNTSEGKSLAEMTSVSNMLERFFVEFAPATVEKNYRWKVFKKDKNSIYLSGIPKEDVLEYFGDDIKSSSSLEVLRNGFFTALPSLISGVKGRSVQMKSISCGDDEDRYEICFFKE